MKKVIAIVERDKCHPDLCKHECMKYDPINRSGGIGFHLSEEHGKAEISDVQVSEIHRICAKMCPFDAIQIVKLPERLNQDPLHKFGNNQFELYDTPIIKGVGVTGILGRNGIGKSTAINILAGILKPNLGKGIATEEEIIHKFKHAVMGEYFTKLYTNNIALSYKPQRVEFLVKEYKGKRVGELLKHVDERNIIKHLIQILELENLYERTVDQLSGGELQRVAICATLAKKADVYYFDEPSSYLDITHRMKVAKLIHELGKQAAVIVVDHDLATLDYISDNLQIVYGEQACYGIFSNVKGVGRGINEYIEGYIADDNVRFRSYKIDFTKAHQEELSPHVIYEYPELEKQFEKFRLHVAAGKLHKGEVLAIMGANGLGKSTFVRMLAGLLKPDKGNVAKVACVFKPQYLEANTPETVEQFLKKHAGNEYNTGWYQTNIIEKLNLKLILKNPINVLSGGELQKIHVAATLSGDHDLIIMDEPSAFVDVEDRLHVAAIIKEFIAKKEKAAIIVDHDIQFVDLVADSLLVFEGEPGMAGQVLQPEKKHEGMNHVLKLLNITYRRDKQSRCARINKPGSQLDKEQRAKGNYYIS